MSGQNKQYPFIVLMLYSVAGFLLAGGLKCVFANAFGELSIEASHYMNLVMLISIGIFIIGIIGFVLTRNISK